MPRNLTMQSAVYATSTFGQALTGGNGYYPSTSVGDRAVTAWPLTLHGRVRGTASGGIEVAGGIAGLAWVGKAANNTALAHFGAGAAGTGNGNDITLSSTVNITDGVDHVLALVVTATGGTFYVDGAQVATSTAQPTFSITNQYFGVRAFFNTEASSTANFPWSGSIDEFAVYNTAKYTAAYTPATTAVSPTDAGLVALYSLDGNGLDSANPPAATALTLTGSATATVGSAITVTVGLNGTKASTTTVNLTAVDGAFSPAQVTVPANGTVTATYTAASTGAKTLTATDAAAALTAATLSVTASAVPVAFDQTKVRFSPYNWFVGTSSAKSNNDGAYARFAFTGASCTLQFDLTNNVAPHAILQYRVDNTGPWTVTTLANNIILAMPSETSGWVQHFVEFEIRQTSEAVSRWNPQSTAVVLVGMIFASGGALGALPTKRAVTAVCFGDSIFNGINAMTNVGDSTLRGNAQMSYMNLIMKRLGFEFGMVAFGGQGWVTTGGGSVPVFPTCWNFLWSGQARDFSTEVPDFIIVNQGQNDASNATTTQVTTVLNGMLAATPRTTKIVMLRPLSGLQAANIQAGIAACTTPSRVLYVDTTGWFTVANSLDNIHPLGWEHNNNIARVGLEALRPVLQPVKGARTQRTINLPLFQDAAGTIPAADTTGLVWSVFDQLTPDALTVAADSGTAATIVSGVLTLTVYSTKAASAQAYLVLANADGSKAFRGPVTLS